MPSQTEAMRERARALLAKIGEAADDPFVDWQIDLAEPVLLAALAEAVAAEREACAQVADPRAVEVPGAFGKTRTFIVGCQEIAAAIRARGEP